MPRGEYQDGWMGDMPEDLWGPKLYERSTFVFEPPEEVEYFHRNLLKDTDVDAPYMESDMPRDTYTQSRFVINTRREGKHTTGDPYLPEGTFNPAAQSLEKDPRSISYDSFIRGFRDQYLARGKFVNFSDDSDHSVPESGIHPTKYVQLIREKGFRWMKNMARFFSTGLDNFAAGGLGQETPRPGVNKRALVTSDGEVVNWKDAWNRSNWTQELTSDTPVGWRRTPDQLFDVAQYGQTRTYDRPYLHDDWYRIQRASLAADEQFSDVTASRVPKSLIPTVRDVLATQKSRKGTFNHPWMSIDGLTILYRGLMPNHTGGKSSDKSVESRAFEIARQYQEKTMQYSLMAPQDPMHPANRVFLVNPRMVEWLGQANRSRRGCTGQYRDVLRLKKAVKFTDPKNLSKETRRIVGKQRASREGIARMPWRSKETEKKMREDSLEVAQYGRNATMQRGKGVEKHGANAGRELIFSDDSELSNRRTSDKSRRSMGMTAEDNTALGPERGNRGAVGGIIGDKYQRHAMVSEVSGFEGMGVNDREGIDRNPLGAQRMVHGTIPWMQATEEDLKMFSMKQLVQVNDELRRFVKAIRDGTPEEQDKALYREISLVYFNFERRRVYFDKFVEIAECDTDLLDVWLFNPNLERAFHRRIKRACEKFRWK